MNVDVRYDVALALAECEAKRRIVKEMATAEWRLGMPAATVQFVLAILALPYAKQRTIERNGEYEH